MSLSRGASQKSGGGLGSRKGSALSLKDMVISRMMICNRQVDEDTIVFKCQQFNLLLALFSAGAAKGLKQKGTLHNSKIFNINIVVRLSIFTWFSPI